MSAEILPPVDVDRLTRIFGEGSGTTAEERARESKRAFVRGLDLLTFDESERAKGRRLSATEALEAYGLDKLAEVASEGAALLCDSVTAAGRVLRERRLDLGLEIRHVASATRLRPEVVEALEASKGMTNRSYPCGTCSSGDSGSPSFRRSLARTSPGLRSPRAPAALSS